MDDLTLAILAAGNELRIEYGWSIDDDWDDIDDPATGVFVTVMRKHLEPFISDDWRVTRIAALKAELKALEQSNG